MKNKSVISKLMGMFLSFTMLMGAFSSTAIAGEIPVETNASGRVDAKTEIYPYKIEGVNYDPWETKVVYVRDNSTIKISKAPGYNDSLSWFGDIFFLDDNNNIVDFLGLVKSGDVPDEGLVLNISSNDWYCEEYQANLRNVVYRIRMEYKENGEFCDASYCYRIYDDVPQNLRTVRVSPFDITIDGKKTTFESFITKEDYFSDFHTTEGSDYYISIRDFAMAMNETAKRFDIGYDAAKKAVTLTSNKVYTPVGTELKANGNKESIVYRVISASGNTAKFYMDGKELNLKAYVVKGNTYFKAQDLANLFHATYTYDSKTHSAEIKTL